MLGTENTPDGERSLSGWGQRDARVGRGDALGSSSKGLRYSFILFM